MELAPIFLTRLVSISISVLFAEYNYLIISYLQVSYVISGRISLTSLNSNDESC